LFNTPTKVPETTDLAMFVQVGDGPVIVQRRVYGAGPMSEEAVEKLDALHSQLNLVLFMGSLLGIEQSVTVHTPDQFVADLVSALAEDAGYDLTVEIAEVVGPEVANPEQYMEVNAWVFAQT